MRLFVAVDLVPSDALRAIAGRLPPHFHATLRFFGEFPEGSLDRLTGAIEEAAASTAPFDLELRGLGAFPSSRQPRVVWVGFGAGREELEQLADRLERALRSREFPSDPRGFQPHATLSRVRNSREKEEADRLLERGASVSFGVQRIAELRLYESRLDAGGASHRCVAEAPLSGSG